jgi:serine protease Do
MKFHRVWVRSYVRIFALAVILSFFMPAGALPAAETEAQDRTQRSFSPLVNQVKHSVVNISTTQVTKESPLSPFFGPRSPFRDFFGDIPEPRTPRRTQALGSGFIIDKTGLILTNNHVVEKATEITVRTDTGKEYSAKIVGRDPKTDLALVQVEPDADFPVPAALGDSNVTEVGDWVMAVGNPFGLTHSVTVGIIGAKGRIIGAGPYDDFLQTDAAINPGNSGGPLFNMRGEVIGINTAIVAQGQGIGFAIPINVAKDLLPQLKAGKVVRGWLGVMIQDVTPELARSFGLKEAKGVVVSDFAEQSPAREFGLRQGDIIVRFNGKEIETSHALSSTVANTPPNTPVKVEVIREGKPQTIEVTLGTMPDDGAPPTEPEADDVTGWGISVQNLTPDLARRFGWGEGERGALVTRITPGSPAADKRLQPGDLIKEVNHQQIQSASDFNAAVKKVTPEQNLLLLVKRGDRTFYEVVERGVK